MTSRRAAAETRISQANLTPRCQQVVDYWLSLWDGDALPAREDFHPAKLGPLLKNTALFDVVPGQSVRVRLMGTGLTMMLGVELTGADWLALVTGKRRETRLQELSLVARGTIGLAHRTVALAHGPQHTFPELLIPFRASKADGSTQVLYFADWFPDNPAIRLTSAEDGIGAQISSTFIALENT